MNGRGRARPKVVLHFGQSLDGKLAAPGQGARALGGADDVRRIDALRAWADAVLVGAATLRGADVPMHLRDEAAVARRQAAGRPPHPRIVVLSGSGRLPPDARVWRRRPDVAAPLVVVGARPDEAALRALLPHVEIWRLPAPDGGSEGHGAPTHDPAAVDVHGLLWRLRAAGTRRLVVEGGGQTAWAFVAARAVDEVWCTVVPTLLGGADGPTPVGGAGFAFDERLSLHLVHARRRGDALYLRYRVARGTPAHTPQS